MDTNGMVRTISLRGGESYFTINDESVFSVIEGNVLVYLVPLENGQIPGRRLFLYEAQAGENIPAFNKEWDGKDWVFCLVALDVARIQEISGANSEELCDEFLNKTEYSSYGGENYAENLLEAYDRNNIKEEGYIYISKKAREDTRQQGFRLIYGLFDKDFLKQKTPVSGNALYDAVSCACDRRKIKIAGYDKIVASTGRRFKLTDIARVSNFICREVLLDHDWQKRDSDVMIGFLEKGHQPIALLPKGLGGYIAYNPKTHERYKVTAENASQIESHAYSLYAPFPNKSLSVWEMFKFGFSAANVSDWVRFLVLMLIGTMIGILLPMLNEQIYDTYIPMGQKSGIVQICAVLLACNLGNLSFTIVKNLSALRGVTKMKNAVLAAVCERLFNLPESFYRDYESADLSDRVLKIEAMFSLISNVAVKTAVSAIFSLLYLSQMNKYAPDLMKQSIIMVIAVMLVIIVMAVVQTKYEKELLENSAEANSRMYQYLGGIQKVRLAGVEDRALLEYLKPYGKTKEIMMRKEKMTNLVEMIKLSATSVFTVIIYKHMIENMMALSVGQFSAFMSAFGAFSGAMLEVGSSLLKLNSLPPMFNRIKPVLKALPEYEEDTELPGDLSGDIEVANVDFAYNEGDDLVLKDLSVHIKSGEYIGIAGSSGCGKSTLLKLLLGFERPSSGKIFYDEKDIDRMDKRELRKKFGVVLQNGRLIEGSIFDNIVISAPNATIKDAERVAEQVGLAEDIKHMPMGMHTVISAEGGTISGGQMQRILIARAIVGKPKILYFDEATSALDNVTQAMVCESLAKLKVTRIVIAHRLSTIADCDRILVMDKGKIVEQGDFESLMAKKGMFYELASRQMT